MFTKENTRKILGIITFAAILFTAAQNMSVTLGVLGKVMGLFTPLLLGFCMAFMINVLMVPIEKLLKHRSMLKVKRPLALLSSLVAIVLVFTILSVIIFPAFQTTIIDLINYMPGFWKNTQLWIDQITADLPFDVATLPDLNIDWQAIGAWAGKFLSVGGTTVFNATMGFTSVFLGATINIVLGLVFAIYLLMSKETLNRQLRRFLYAYLPTAKVEWLLNLSALSQRVFSAFITGQLTEALIIGSLCFVGMLVLGIPHALVVSALIAFTALIPVFGAIIGIVVGAFLIIMVSPVKALWFIIFIIVLQQLESNLIYPKVMGDSIGLPGIWVLVAVTLGGSSFGILGMIIGVPLCSVIYTMVKEHVKVQLKEKKVPQHKVQ